MKRRYAVQDRDFNVRPCASRRAAQRDQAAHGGLVVTRKDQGVWTPYTRFSVLLSPVRRLMHPRTGDSPEDDQCFARLRELRKRIPALVFDSEGGEFFIILPGRPEPFRSPSICALVTDVETWLASQQAEAILGALLFGNPWRTGNT